MMKSEEKRTPFLGSRTVRDGSVTLQKLGDDVLTKINAGGVEMMTQAAYNALQTKDPQVLYLITEDEQSQ